ncbi:MAG: CUAEP/CCAEP-tail radical SAM (seleno)protein [Vicinamibacterales bacterium]
MRALLVSTYELGRQPFGLASPAAWLRREGFDVTCVDVSRQPLPVDVARDAELVAFYLPMHTATRLAAPLIRKVRQINPLTRISAYGLYAPLNDTWLRELGVNDVLGGEFESDLASIARQMVSGDGAPSARDAVGATGSASLPRLQFLVPDRSGLPPLARYATLEMGDGRRTVVGYTEASRGCRHLCRHCPVVPVYNGQFRLVQSEVVAADIAAQVAAGAGHITFGDPDFFNGPTHALRIVTALHEAHPEVTYDVTVKVEHLLKHRHLLSKLAETGCAFVTTAVESLDDRVLAILEKGHTRADFLEAVRLCRASGLTLVPTFVAFHPWLTLDGYCDLVDTIAALDLVDHVAPIQLAIRLLVPAGSRLLELEEVRTLAETFDPRTLTHRWKHQDPRVDRLHDEVNALVGARLTADRRALFGELHALAHDRAGAPASAWVPRGERATVPYLTEPWYCCAEPSPEQVGLV